MVKRSEDITKKGLSAAKYSIFFRLLAQIVGVVSTILLVRTLSEHDYGIYNLLYSVIALLGMFFSFGIANTLQRYMPEYYNRGEFKVAHQLYFTASLIRLLSNVFVLGAILLLWHHVAPLLKITAYKNYFFLFTLVILLHLQRGILEACLNSFFLQKYSQGFSIIFVLVKGIGYAVSFLLHLDLWFILMIDLFAYLVVFILLLVVYQKRIPHNQGELSVLSRSEKRRISRYALFYNFNDAGVGLLNADFDNFIIAMFLDPVAVGGYAFCCRIVKMINNTMPISYLRSVFNALFFSLGNTDNDEEIKLKFQMFVKFKYMFMVPVLFYLLLYGESIIAIFFGNRFVSYSWILIAVYFFSFFDFPAGLIAQLKERPDIVFYSKLFAIYNLIADVILINFFGVWGAVLATGTATFFKNLFIWFFVRKTASMEGTFKFWLKLFLFWGATFGIVNIIKMFISSIIPQIIVGTIIFIGFFLLSFSFMYITAPEKAFLNEIAGKSERVRTAFRALGLLY